MFLKRLLFILWFFPATIGFCAGQQIDFLAAGLTDTDGNPLAGGLVYTYSSGTLASKTTYVESSMATPKSNPIVLDTYGRALAFADGRYKFIIKTATGTTLYTWDGLTYKNVQTTTGSIITTSITGQTTITLTGYTDSSVKPFLYLDGLKQAENTYTWTAPTITLTTPIPISGITIEAGF